MWRKVQTVLKPGSGRKLRLAIAGVPTLCSDFVRIYSHMELETGIELTVPESHRDE